MSALLMPHKMLWLLWQWKDGKGTVNERKCDENKSPQNIQAKLSEAQRKQQNLLEFRAEKLKERIFLWRFSAPTIIMIDQNIYVTFLYARL